MPKVIENLQEKILEAAETLFSEHGYNDVDVRAISNKVGIAVGTLYNYFPDKKTLFIEVFKKSWEKIYLRLNDIIESDYNNHKKLILFLNEIYDGFVQRKGIGVQLLIDSLHGISASTIDHSKNTQYKGLEEVGNILKEKARILIAQIAHVQAMQLDGYITDKLSDTLLLLIWGSVSKHQENKAESINFICDIIESYISEHGVPQKIIKMEGNK